MRLVPDVQVLLRAHETRVTEMDESGGSAEEIIYALSTSAVPEGSKHLLLCASAADFLISVCVCA